MNERDDLGHSWMNENRYFCLGQMSVIEENGCEKYEQMTFSSFLQLLFWHELIVPHFGRAHHATTASIHPLFRLQ
jgi:hypothetical protein